jgi:hypothetical protein
MRLTAVLAPAAAFALGCSSPGLAGPNTPAGVGDVAEPGAEPGPPPTGVSAAPITQCTYEPGLVPAQHAAPPAALSPVAAPDARAPTTGMVLEGGPLGHDPQVAASDGLLMVYTSHTYQLLDKATGKPLPTREGDEIAPKGTFTSLFEPVWAPRPHRGGPNPDSINHRLAFATGEPLACDPMSPMVGTACVQEFYDTRVQWDPQRRRFWVESAARNHLWICVPSAHQSCADTKFSQTQSRRYIAIAVSRTEDPRDGFHRYILVNEYSDWPKIAVHDRYLILNHRGASHLYVFDADKLAAGNPDKGPVLLANLDARSFPGAKYLDPVTHHGPTGGATYLLGSNGTNQVIPFALVNPDPARAMPPRILAGPPITLGAKLGTLENNAVFRDGKLYFTFAEWVPTTTSHEPFRRVHVFRAPVRPAGDRLWATDDPAQGYLDGIIGGREPDDAPDDVVDYAKPALDVDGRGNVVVVYSRKGYRTRTDLPPEVRYSILYNGESKARPGVLVRRGSAMGLPDIDAAGIDLAFAQTDPDDATVWITHAYAAKDTHGYKQIAAAVRP